MPVRVQVSTPARRLRRPMSSAPQAEARARAACPEGQAWQPSPASAARPLLPRPPPLQAPRPPAGATSAGTATSAGFAISAGAAAGAAGVASSANGSSNSGATAGADASWPHPPSHTVTSHASFEGRSPVNIVRTIPPPRLRPWAALMRGPRRSSTRTRRAGRIRPRCARGARVPVRIRPMSSGPVTTSECACGRAHAGDARRGRNAGGRRDGRRSARGRCRFGSREPARPWQRTGLKAGDMRLLRDARRAGSRLCALIRACSKAGELATGQRRRRVTGRGIYPRRSRRPPRIGRADYARPEPVTLIAV